MTEPAKKVLHAAVTDDCIARMKSGEIETIPLDGETVLEIRYLPEKQPATYPGRRGKGTYIFMEQK